VRSELLTLKTLADVRTFIGHIPAARRQFETWQTVVRRLKAAAAERSLWATKRCRPFCIPCCSVGGRRLWPRLPSEVFKKFRISDARSRRRH
jgi:hypothetical protein